MLLPLLRPVTCAGEMEAEASEVQSMHSTMYGGAQSVGQVSSGPAAGHALLSSLALQVLGARCRVQLPCTCCLIWWLCLRC